MNTHHETNPHFVRPSQDLVIEPSGSRQQHPRWPTTSTTAAAGPWGDRDRDRPRREGRPHHSGHQRRPRPSQEQQQHPEKQNPPVAAAPLVPLHAQHPDEQHRLEPFRGPHPEQTSTRHPGDPEPDPRRTPAATSPLLRPGPQPSPHEPTHSRRHRHSGGGPQWMPEPRKTKAPTWFMAVFCFILWVVVILGGLIVLVVYLVFRPRSPRFEVSSATLNAAYLDMGYLLNADISLLANFTNPNRKVSVEFSYMFVELYYGRTLVATQHVDPFTAHRGQNTFANLHMVTSQVRLAELEVQRIKRQTQNNGIVFVVKGYFRAKSKFGSLFRYSYWLHSRCSLMLTRPPGGVLVAKNCNPNR